MTLFEVYRWGLSELGDWEDPHEAKSSSEAILRDFLGLTQAQFLASLQATVSEITFKRFKRAIGRRKKRIPVAYILGHSSFCGRVYRVRPGVLIPRPETEGLLAHFQTRALSIGNPDTVMDVGFGTGILALEVERNLKKTAVFGWDMSRAAYRCAQENAAQWGQSGVTFFRKDFFKDEVYWGALLKQKNTWIVSNPPYIAYAEERLLSPEVHYEPKRALYAGVDGLHFFRRFFLRLSGYSWRGFFEIGFRQQDALTGLLQHLGYSQFWFYPDMQGHPRILEVDHSQSLQSHLSPVCY